jgi:mitogen-activated protein kinase kinase 1
LAHVSFQILYGLAYLKRQKRVHRDIKPSNLLINSAGEVKVTDFGVSAELGNSIAMCGTFVGTFKYTHHPRLSATRENSSSRYMSPERICSAPYSFASDIWSTGLVLLECITGVYPYPEEHTCIGMAQTILEADVPVPPTGASREFVEFIAHCLNKDPRSRLPAEILLTAPWLQKHGAVSIASSVAALQCWISATCRQLN